MRYELKMPFDEALLNQIIKTLYASPLGIQEIFHERKVNNVYFDTLQFDDYSANVDGLYHRSKFRIRWYGSEDHFYPILEEKIKEGDLGYKRTVEFDDFLTQEDILSRYQQLMLNDFALAQRFHHRHPSLINSYMRRYFLSQNRKIRLTLDKDIHYAHPVHHHLSIPVPHLMILEVKFEQEDYLTVQHLLQSLNLRFDKNSKYVNGIALIKNASI